MYMDKNTRIKLLRFMDKEVCEVIGDEDIWEIWIAEGVPDCANYSDFEYIAESDIDFNEVFELFFEIFMKLDESTARKIVFDFFKFMRE